MESPKATGSTRLAVYYITAGSILLIWPVVTLLYYWQHGSSSDVTVYVMWGLLCTGVVLTTIGLVIGQAARSANVAPAPAPNPAPAGMVPNNPMMPGAAVAPMVMVPAPMTAAAPVRQRP